LPVARDDIDIVVPGDSGRAKRSGVRVHRSPSLVAAEVTLRHGIPLTSPTRTIADLRKVAAGVALGSVSGRELRKAIRQANVLGLPIGEESGADRTRSDLERNFLWLCRNHRIPPPEVNVSVGRYLVDFLWRGRRLVVETDGYVFHRGKTAFQDDRRRDFELRRLGFDVIRLSERQIEEEPERVAETLAATLGGRRRG
jgi:very-short-patch-repair endonuclease